VTVPYLDIGLHLPAAFRPQNVYFQHPVHGGQPPTAGFADNKTTQSTKSSAPPELSGRTVPEGVIIATLPIRDYRVLWC